MFLSLTNQLTVCEQQETHYDTPHDHRSCLESLKLRLAHTGSACSPHGHLLSLLRDEEGLRVIGAKSLNALLRQISLSPKEVSEVKLHKRRLRKRLAKRGWDNKVRSQECDELQSIRLLEEERSSLQRERDNLLTEINGFETEFFQLVSLKCLLLYSLYSNLLCLDTLLCVSLFQLNSSNCVCYSSVSN